jgi:hypothetical protein
VLVQQRGDLHAFQVCQQERHVIDSFDLESLKDLVYHASILNRPTNPERRKKVSERQDFGLPLHILVEPSEWYSFHRKPTIVEGGEDRTRVLVRFGAMSSSGEDFGGTCLYALREGRWGAYRIRPSESRDIATAEAWLVKRKWKQWGS